MKRQPRTKMTGRISRIAASIIITLGGFSARAAVLQIVNETYDPPKLATLLGWEDNVSDLAREYVSEGVLGSTGVQTSATFPAEGWANVATSLCQSGAVGGNDWATRENSVLAFDIKVDRPDLAQVGIFIESWGDYLWNFGAAEQPPKGASVGAIPLGSYEPGKFKTVVVPLDDPLWVQNPYPDPDNMLPHFDPSGDTYQIWVTIDTDGLPARGPIAVTIDNVTVKTKNAMIPLNGWTRGSLTVEADGSVVIEEQGIAEHLGRFDEKITFTPEGVGVVTITAADGDELHGYLFMASMTEGAISIVGGTGRFDGATGSYSVSLTWLDPSSWIGTASGSISTVGWNKK